MLRDVRIVRADYRHAALLAVDMRDADAAEVRSAYGWDPLTALCECLSQSEYAYTLLFDRLPAAMFGVVPMPGSSALSSKGLAWALTGRAVDRHPRPFLRACRPGLKLLQGHYRDLGNLVDGRYASSLRWAGWLGFRVDDPVTFGVDGLPFHPITLRGELHG